MTKKRILMLNYEFPPIGGGAANATKHILQEFSSHDDVQIHLITSSVSEFRKESFAKNITVHYLDIGKNNRMHDQSNKELLLYSWKAFNYAKDLKKEVEFDVAHAFFGIPCGFLTQRLGLPYIVSLRGSDVPFYSDKYKVLDTLFFQRMSRGIWRDAHHVVANSSGLKDLALETSPQEEVKVIYNGVDINKFFAKKEYTKGEVFTIISVGRLIKRKGYAYLIEALEGVENVELILCGDGPLRDELEALAIQKNVKVNFKGNVSHEELVPIYQKSDLCVLPSFNEGMSNTVLEAMACGLPIIVTNVGGMSELVDGNGHMIEIGEWDKLTEFIKLMRDDCSHREKSGKRSAKIAQSMSWSKVAEDYKKLYDEMMLE